jgi:hypothetical protein
MDMLAATMVLVGTLFIGYYGIRAKIAGVVHILTGSIIFTGFVNSRFLNWAFLDRTLLAGHGRLVFRGNAGIPQFW